jgi:hypothetical protein
MVSESDLLGDGQSRRCPSKLVRMGTRFHSGRAAAAACICLLMFAPPGSFAAKPQSQGAGSSAQSQSASGAKKQPADPKPCSVIPDPDPCGTTPKPSAPGGSSSAPSATDRFPFPGSASGSSSNAGPGIGGAPEAPQAPATGAQPSATPTDTINKFPFPGGSAAPNAAPEAPISSTPEGGSSSSSSSNDGSDPADALPGDTPDLKDAGSEGTQSKPGGHLLHRAAPKVKTQSADEREAEDLDVAKFYFDSGDLQGAYLRAQDAVKISPEDPDAHFALAELALKLGKKEQAIVEYNACLKLDPTGKEKKDSSKALARLAK